MTQGLPRTRFNSAGLVRVLAELAVADPADPKQTFAERLGEWLDLKAALALYSALNATAADALPRAAPVAALHAELARVRGELSGAVAAAGAQQPGGTNLALPAPLPNASIADAADFTPFHRYYLAHQRAMAAAVGPLRAGVRAALGRQSAALRQLAALDAVMEQALSPREASLLATVPVLLGKRFAQLFEAHQRAHETAASDRPQHEGAGLVDPGSAAAADAPPADDPARWMQPGAWLARFCAEMQRVLLAELELRLMPVVGLLAALDTESTGQE